MCRDRIKAAPPAPPPSPWDVAFGAGITSDYYFRGITQSNHRPAVAVYFEPRYNVTKDLQLYAGIAGESISFPNRAAAEIDMYAGFRPTLGPLILDFGGSRSAGEVERPLGNGDKGRMHACIRCLAREFQALPNHLSSPERSDTGPDPMPCTVR